MGAPYCHHDGEDSCESPVSVTTTTIDVGPGGPREYDSAFKGCPS